MEMNKGKENAADTMSVCNNGLTSGFVGESAPFRQIRELIEKVAAYKSPIMIVGETGTGKEIVARQIHTNSGRRQNTFFPVNCSAISKDLFESQFFGHVKGAFTGAESNMLGYFRAADGGTLFLDEVTELDLAQQAKLLRVLQESCVRPVGSTELYPMDVRIICATNRDLKQAVKQGEFRADLYFRLNVVQFATPPLRQRKEDILLLAKYFLQKQAQLYGEPPKTLSSRTKSLLMGYSWPGNVRELANVIEHVYVTATSDIIDLQVLPSSVFAMPQECENTSEVKSLDEIKKKALVNALDRNSGRRTHTARELQISYRKLVGLMNRYDIHTSHTT